MDSPMLKMLKSQNPDKEYPSNIGLKWFEDEETILLEELNKNTDIEIIAQNHNRTIGGINSRRKEIAYKMYLKNISIEEIIEKTKLDEECIKQTIDKRKNYNSTKITETKKPISLESEIIEMKNEIIEMKNEIKELKNTIKEMVEMMKAVYDFEDT
jgi:hypothetical protein